MSIDWFTTVAEIVHTPPEQVRQIEKIAALLLSSGEYVGNDHRSKISHLVPSITDLEWGDEAAAICGQLVSGADLFPDYDWCADCVADPESSGSGEA